jgi:hypothetical protein
VASGSQALGAFGNELRAYRHDPDGFARNILDIDPHEGQTRWLNNSAASENILVTGNRWGKSQTAAMKRIWKCIYRKGWTPEIRAAQERKHELYRSRNVAMTAYQAGLVWHKAFAMLQGPKASWLVKDVKWTPFPTIEFVTGAIFDARSTAREGVHLLGDSIDDLNWDEAAFETHFVQIRDNVLRMRLVDRRGKLDYTSTGNGRNEFGRYFLDAMAHKESALGAYAQTGPSYENPYVPHDQLDLNAKRMSDQKRRQNINGEIVDGGGDFFAAEDLEIARTTLAGELDLNDESVFKVLAVDDEDIIAWVQLFPNPAAPDQPWRLRYPSHRYIHGWDLADKRDWTVGSTWDLSTPRATLVEFERFHKRGWDHVYARIRDRQRRYGGNTYLDLTGVGDVVGDQLSDIGAEGINFAGKKEQLLEGWRILINLRQVRWPEITPWVDEHSWYTGPKTDAKLIKDCVMSGAVAGWFMRRGVMTNAPASAYR